MTTQRSSAIFVGDAVSLDFLNSIAVPVDTRVEWITSGKDLLDWLNTAGLVPAETCDTFLKSAVPGELDAVAAQARALREWFRGFVVAHKGSPLSETAIEDLGPLNGILGRDEEFGQIVAHHASEPAHGHNGLALQMQRRWRSPDSLLIPIAKSMANLIVEDNFANIKACEGHDCTLLFIDRTRGHARRWCRMAVCGNRHKATGHRARARKENRAAG